MSCKARSLLLENQELAHGVLAEAVPAVLTGRAARKARDRVGRLGEEVIDDREEHLTSVEQSAGRPSVEPGGPSSPATERIRVRWLGAGMDRLEWQRPLDSGAQLLLRVRFQRSPEDRIETAGQQAGELDAHAGAPCVGPRLKEIARS